jgi:predicted nucleic acid-binding protein
MREFADTSYYLALLNEDDEFHSRARELGRRPSRRHVTTAWVLTELADALSTDHHFEQAGFGILLR